MIDNDGDKLKPRWAKGIFVGKTDQTDEFVLLTPKGASKSRSVKRLEAAEAWGREFMAACIGAPWNPTGRPSTAPVQSGNALAPGNKMRRMYITPKVLEKYKRTPGCEACALHQGSHSEHCRARIEKLMIEAGDAFKAGGLEQQDSGTVDAAELSPT